MAALPPNFIFRHEQIHALPTVLSFLVGTGEKALRLLEIASGRSHAENYSNPLGTQPQSGGGIVARIEGLRTRIFAEGRKGSVAGSKRNSGERGTATSSDSGLTNNFAAFRRQLTLSGEEWFSRFRDKDPRGSSQERARERPVRNLTRSGCGLRFSRWHRARHPSRCVDTFRPGQAEKGRPRIETGEPAGRSNSLAELSSC